VVRSKKNIAGSEPIRKTYPEKLIVYRTSKWDTGKCDFFSLIETTKSNNLKPYAYLPYLFEKLPSVDKKRLLISICDKLKSEIFSKKK